MADICPICGAELIDLYGHMFDVDRKICGISECGYEVELDTTTVYENGTFYTIQLGADM